MFKATDATLLSDARRSREFETDIQKNAALIPNVARRELGLLAGWKSQSIESWRAPGNRGPYRRGGSGCNNPTSQPAADGWRNDGDVGVRSMNETFPLECVTEAYDRMMSGKARFRVVLTTGS